MAPRPEMNHLALFQKPMSSLWYIPALTIFFFLWTACAPHGKPSYLKEWKDTINRNRWEVVQIDPQRLSPDEKALFEKLGPPKYVIHFWNSTGKKGVYQWVYENPPQFYRFLEGKRADDVSVRDYAPWWR